MHCCVCFPSDCCGLQRAEWNESERETEEEKEGVCRCSEWEREAGRAVEVSVECWGCEGMKAVGAYDPTPLLHLCSLFEVVASPWSFFFEMADFMCLIYGQLASPPSRKQWCVACAFGSPNGSG